MNNNFEVIRIKIAEEVDRIELIKSKALAKLMNYTGDISTGILDRKANVTVKCDICGITRTVQVKDSKKIGFNIGIVMKLDKITVDFYTIICNGCINESEKISKRIKELRESEERTIKYK